MAEQREPQPVFVVPTPAGAAQQQKVPSTIVTVEDQAQVMVDTWGHTGAIVKGMIVNRADAEKQGYDWDHALRMGAIRPLTEAEVRSQPTHFSALADGSEDEGLRRSLRFHAGLLDEQPKTVTTGQGPAEPKEFAKPTLEYSGPSGEAARPVEVVGSPQEAEDAARRETRVVATPSGPAFVSREEQEAALRAEEEANNQRVQRRGRRE